MSERTPGKNWVQRHIIQTELEARKTEEVLDIEAPVDPLAAVKSYYYQRYTEAIGQPGLPAESSPVLTQTADLISQLVDNTANQSITLCNGLREKIDSLPQELRADFEQYAIHIQAEASHGAETILEETIKSLAEDDPLSNFAPGRLLRKVKPSPQTKRLHQAVSDYKKSVTDIANEFEQDLAQRYRR